MNLKGDDRSPRSIDGATRRQLAMLARRRRSRTIPSNLPTNWRPHEVRNPDGILDSHFRDSSAWELIATRLECGEEAVVINLHVPKGAKGYVMKIELEPGLPLVYVKLQLGAGKVIGRSFHYTDHD